MVFSSEFRAGAVSHAAFVGASCGRLRALAWPPLLHNTSNYFSSPCPAVPCRRCRPNERTKRCRPNCPQPAAVEAEDKAAAVEFAPASPRRRWQHRLQHQMLQHQRQRWRRRGEARDLSPPLWQLPQSSQPKPKPAARQPLPLRISRRSKPRAERGVLTLSWHSTRRTPLNAGLVENAFISSVP